MYHHEIQLLFIGALTSKEEVQWLHVSIHGHEQADELGGGACRSEDASYEACSAVGCGLAVLLGERCALRSQVGKICFRVRPLAYCRYFRHSCNISQ